MAYNDIIQTECYHPTMIVRVSAKLTDHAKSYQRAHYNVKRDSHKNTESNKHSMFLK